MCNGQIETLEVTAVMFDSLQLGFNNFYSSSDVLDLFQWRIMPFPSFFLRSMVKLQQVAVDAPVVLSA